MTNQALFAMMPVDHPNHIENGREYHGFRRGMYMYPCDKVSISFDRIKDPPLKALQDEQQRMDYLHALFEVARRKELHEHPIVSIDGPPRILDLGCGTGLWVLSMAE
ncbi:MAG: hypothetical protein Q9178_004302 [Gyalolechia marmorata]